MARGEFSIVIASLGATIEPELSALAGTHVLITVLTGPVITRFAATATTQRPPVRPPLESVPADGAARAARARCSSGHRIRNGGYNKILEPGYVRLDCFDGLEVQHVHKEHERTLAQVDG